MLDELTGHFWTIAPNLWLPPRAPRSSSWSTTLEDSVAGRVTLRGEWSAPASYDTALVIVHGLGGTHDRHYCRRAARAAARRGWASLRLSLRGADRRGEDLHHAGLVEDIEAALRGEPLSRTPRVFLLGYSLGGHLVVRAAAHQLPDRVRAVGAVCAPIDLDESATHLDDKSVTLYRRMILSKLRDIYRPFAARHPEWPDPASLDGLDSIRDWDARTVVPRFGFDSVEHYYQSESAGPYLPRLRVPTFAIWSNQDPMVDWRQVKPHLANANDHLTAELVNGGGHVGFPAWCNVEDRTLEWMDRQSS